MSNRVVLIIGLLLLLGAGVFAVSKRMIVAEVPPVSVAPPRPSAAVPPAPKIAAPQPVAPKPEAKLEPKIEPRPEPIPEAKPEPLIPPVVVLPPDNPPPAAPPEPAPAPVVTAPPTSGPAPAQPPPDPVIAALPEQTPAPAQPPAPEITVPSPMPQERPAVTDKKDATPAKQLFSSEKLPSLGKAMAIGYYPRGCLQGGVELPVTGPTWQVMRLSRNRNWGHPELVKFLENFAPRAAKATGWNGILIGDMAQPRGGPLPFGHLSHQIGLDVDIWFMPMPNHVLSKDEREKTSAINVVAEDWKHVDPKNWTPQHIAFIKTAAEAPDVERVLVNAAIKQELCRVEDKSNASWMSKVRPWYGHHDHIHVRLACPPDSPNCRKQPPVPGDDGCNPKQLEYWFSDKVLHPKPRPPGPPAPPAKPLMLADLPPACKSVLDAPAKQAIKANAE